MGERAGKSLKQKPVTGNFDVIVIGSGIGGLATAAVLARRRQKRVLVLERHYVAGGFTHIFTRPGYEWDVGVHYIGNVGSKKSPVRRMFDEITGGRLEWSPQPDCYDRVFLGEKSFDLVKGRRAYREKLLSYFPKEERAIDEYLKAVDAAVKWGGLYFAEKLLPAGVARLAGPAMRAPFLKWGGKTTREVLEKITGNQELIGVLTAQYGDYGLPPSQGSFGVHAFVVDHYLRDGGFYPVGSSAKIAVEAEKEIEAAGGRVAVNAEVKEIIVEKNKAVGVRLATGEEFRAPAIVSDAGAANTFEKLLPPGVREKTGILPKLAKVPPSVGHLCLYVGFSATSKELGLEGTNLWLCPDEKHDQNFARSAGDLEAPFPGVFISFPSVKDPTFEQRYPGHSTAEIITFIPYSAVEKWENSKWHKRGEDYEAFKAKLSERLLEKLYAKVPQTRGKVAFHELSTPLSTKHFANYAKGETYGLSHGPARFRQNFLRVRTPVENLYLTGQDLMTCGVSSALFGGVLTACAVGGLGLLGEVMGKKPPAAKVEKRAA